MTRPLFGVGLFAILVCSDGSDPKPTVCDEGARPECSCGYPAVEIGDGQVPFNHYVYGQSATIWPGADGGWYVPASVRVVNTSRRVAIAATVHALPERVLVSNNAYLRELPPTECWGELDNLLLYLDVPGSLEGDLHTPPELLVGKTLRIAVTVIDSDGREAGMTVDVVGALAPLDLHDSGTARDSGAPSDSGGSDSGGATDSGEADSGGVTDTGEPD